MDDWSFVQAQSALPSGGSQYFLSVLGGGEMVGPPAHSKLGIPVVADKYNVFGKRVSRAPYKEMLNASKNLQKLIAAQFSHLLDGNKVILLNAAITSPATRSIKRSRASPGIWLFTDLRS